MQRYLYVCMESIKKITHFSQLIIWLLRFLQRKRLVYFLLGVVQNKGIQVFQYICSEQVGRTSGASFFQLQGYSLKCTASYFKVRIDDPNCCHKDIKIEFRLVHRLDGTIPFHSITDRYFRNQRGIRATNYLPFSTFLQTLENILVLGTK